MKNNRILRKFLAAGIAAAGLSSMAAHAYGPLYIFDYTDGTPYHWDVTNPVKVWTDGGNFASGTVTFYDYSLPTCNQEGGWVCSYDLYVEFTNEQGVARVSESLASWSAVPTSSFQAEVTGNFADIGIGGDNGDITGAPDEFSVNEQGEVVHEVVGTVNNGGIHVIFDEDGSVMTNVLGVPFGVLGVATPEWADEETGVITEGWVVIGGAQTYYNDADLAQMAGVITHELGHSFNLAHSQTNGQLVMFTNQAIVTPGPVDCSAHWYLGGEYQLPFPQDNVATAADMEVMYPYINNNPNAYPTPTGQYQATVSTAEDFAAISSIYPAASFASDLGSVSGTVTYPFSSDGVIGVNIVARNIDNPYEDAITVMSGDWNDGVAGAIEGVGEFTLKGLTPGARYAIHAENIYAGGFPTPQVALPGPSEYFNGNRENDDATSDNACDYVDIVLAAGANQQAIDIQMNGMKRALNLVINPAPNSQNITENGKVTGGDIINWYGETESWIYDESKESYSILPMGGIRLSENGSVVAGRAVIDGEILPAMMVPGKKIEIIPTPGINGCDQGGGVVETYANFAISPDGSTMGGFLWNCDGSEDYQDFTVSAATYSEKDGWTILNDKYDNNNARVNSLANNGTAVGWAEDDFGWWEGTVWMNGEELSLLAAAPANIIDVGEATAVNTAGSIVVGINSWDDEYNQRGYMYNTGTGEFEILDIYEACPPFDWFCYGVIQFNPYDISDEGTLVGAIGRGPGSIAHIHNDLLGTQKLVDFLKAQGVINANDVGLASNVTKISNNGKHLVGWAAFDGYLGSFKLTLDQLYVCRNDKTMQVGYPQGVASQLDKGATLGMCEADLPLQYKANF